MFGFIISHINSFKMRKTTIRDIWTSFDKDPQEVVDKCVKLGGRVFTRRGNDTLLFIELIDGSTIRTIQCVCDKKKYPEQPWDDLWDHVNRGSTLSLYGTIITSPAK